MHDTLKIMKRKKKRYKKGRENIQTQRLSKYLDAQKYKSRKMTNVRRDKETRKNKV